MKLNFPVFVLEIEGLGPFRMADDSVACAFVFTSEDNLIAFCDTMEAPEFKNLVSRGFTREQFIGYLKSLVVHTQWLAINGTSKFEYKTVRVDDLLAALEFRMPGYG